MATTRTKSRAKKSTKPPEVGLVVMPRVNQDFGNFYQIELTPERAKRVLHAAAYGEPFEQHVLFDEMLETDSDLDNAYRTRLLGLTNLEWELVSALQVGRSPSKLTAAEENLAQEVLDYCLEVVDRIEGFDDMLCHTADSIGRGTAVGQFIWDSVEGQRRPIAAEGVSGTQLRIESSNPTQLRIVTEGDTIGIPIASYPAGQFLVRQPRAIGGSYFRGGLLRAAVVGHMVKRVGRKSWWFGIEKFGLPISVAKYDTIDGESKANILSMLTSLGVARGGLFPKGCEFEFIEFNQQGQWPHERLLMYVDAGYSKLFLGQTLTTQISETGGAMAAATVHNEVRQDLRDDDRASEARDVREQLLRPVVLYKFGEAALRFVPHYRRVVEEPQDDAADMATLRYAVNDLGYPVPMRHVHDRFSLPVVEGTDLDAPLPGRAVAPSPFDAGTDLGANREHAAGCLCHRCGARANLRANADRELSRVLNRRSPLTTLGTWIAAAVLASQSHTLAAAERFADALAVGEAKIMRAAPDALDGAIAEVLLPAFEALPHTDLAELNRQSFLAARLHGEHSAQIRVQRRLPAGEAELSANAERIDFEKLPFIEAIESFRDRIGIAPDEFLKLDAEARSRAWRVAGVWDMNLLAVLHTNLVQSIANGETARDFRLRVLPQMYEQSGWAGERPWHAQLVYETNYSLATAAGRWRQYDELDIGHWRFIYVSKADCPLCAPLDGKIFTTRDTKLVPPIHWGCICYEEVVFPEELLPREVIRSRDLVHPLLDRERSRAGALKFNVREYAALEPLNLAKYPAQYHEAFKRLAEARDWQVAA